MNAFESGERKNVPAVLVYLFREGSEGREFLMIFRGRPGDFHSGKWNGLGGKCEADEAYLEAAVRETQEESGIALGPESFEFAGFIQFPNFKPRKAEDWSVMVFQGSVSTDQSATALKEVAEGSLHWIPESKLLSLNLWPGDREFLPWVLQGRKFHGALWYGSDGNVSRSQWQMVP